MGEWESKRLRDKGTKRPQYCKTAGQKIFKTVPPQFPILFSEMLSDHP